MSIIERAVLTAIVVALVAAVAGRVVSLGDRVAAQIVCANATETCVVAENR